jgi:hypothetical protein
MWYSRDKETSMPPTCSICGQFRKADSPHECRKPGPRPSGNAKWRSDSPEAQAYRAEYARKWRAAHPGYGKRYYEYAADERQRLRVAAFIAYSGDPPRCVCCGETALEFLTLDHMNGDGAAERLANPKNVGVGLYRRLRQQGWPEGFQTLCFNCNSALGMFGYCPHAPDKPLRERRRVLAIVH